MTSIEAASTPQAQTWRILHIDDDEDDYYLVRSMLREAQGRAISVDWAPTYGHGRQKLRANHYAAVLIDYDLGAKTGIQLIEEFAERGYPAPLILLTGRGSYEVDVQAMRAGATLYLTKSEINPLLLERSIRYAIERKETETRLRQSEERFQAILENSLDVAYRRDLRTDRYDYLSPVIEQITGFSAEEMSSMPHSEILARVHPDDMPGVEANLEQAIEQGRAKLEYRFKVKDGEYRWLADYVTVTCAADGSPLYRNGIVRDVTGQRNMLEQMEKEQARLEAVLDALPVGVWIADQNGRLLRKNQHADRMWAGNAPLLKGVEQYPLYTAWYTDSGKPLAAEDYPLAQQLHSTQPVEPVELNVRRFDGTPGTFIVSAAPIKDHEGNLQGAVAINVDISDRKQAEQALELERAKLAAVIDQLPFGVSISDASGTVLSMNDVCLDMHGFSSQGDMLSRLEGYGQEFELRTLDGQLLPLDEWPASKALRGEFVRGFDLYLQNTLTGQKQPVSYTAVPVHDSQGQLTLIVYLLQDLTERLQALKVLEESHTQLQAILFSLNEGVAIIDFQGQMLDMNPSALELLGYSNLTEARKRLPEYAQEFEVSTLEGQALPFEDWPLSRLARGETFTGIEVRVVCKRSGKTWIGSFNGKPVYSPTGEALFGVFTLRDITRQKQAEDALRQSEERYRLAARATNDAIWDWDLVADEVHWNEALGNLFGFELASHAVTPSAWWYTRLHPEEAAQVTEQLRAVIEGDGEVWDAQYRFRRADGTYAEVYDRGWVVRDESGRPLRMVGAMRDITARKHVEDALRQSEMRWRRLADAMPQLVWTAEPDGTVDYYNQRYKLYGGVTPLEENRWEWGPVLHPDDLQPTIDAWQQALSTATTYQIEHRVRMADGTFRWHLSRGIPSLNEHGQLVKWYGTATDIHDYYEIQETLRQREQRMHRLFEANLIGIVVRDRTGRVIEANDAYLRIVGYSHQDVQAGRLNVRDITPPEYHVLDQECTQGIQEHGFCKPYEKEYVRQDGRRVPILVGYSRFQKDADSETEFIGFILDLSELKKAQAELAEYAGKLKRSNEELENFAFVASHDLQEPLRKIYMFSSTLRNQLAGQVSVESQEYLDRMQSAAERMQSMINGLLELSRVSTRGGSFGPVALTPLAEEVVSDLELQLRTTGGQVNLEPLPAVTGDVMQLRQLLQNLISNGLKFHKPDVPPEVRISGRNLPDTKTPKVEISIEDNGIGFDPAQAEALFQPFVRLHGRSSPYEGSGMGLAICRKIAERHGGDIRATSQPGEGSRFIITLPGI